MLTSVTFVFLIIIPNSPSQTHRFQQLCVSPPTLTTSHRNSSAYNLPKLATSCIRAALAFFTPAASRALCGEVQKFVPDVRETNFPARTQITRDVTTAGVIEFVPLCECVSQAQAPGGQGWRVAMIRSAAMEVPVPYGGQAGNTVDFLPRTQWDKTAARPTSSNRPIV
jgi:hypothetical protein